MIMISKKTPYIVCWIKKSEFRLLFVSLIALAFRFR